MPGAIRIQRLLLLTTALIAGSSSILVAQGVPPPPNPGRDVPSESQAGDLVFKTSVRRVIVDVVVTDSLGRPVSNLRADDFRITEDGKPQRIRSFDIHDFEPVSDSLPALPAYLPTNTFINVPGGPERGPLYVLLLDLLNMEVSDQPTARKQLLEFIRNKPVGSRFAVFVLTDRLYLVQGFTEDRNVLADSVDPRNPHSRIPKIFLYADNYRPFISTPGVLAHIGEYLSALPGHKNLLWFSGSFPSAIMASSDPKTEALSVDDQIKEATDSLARARVAVYPVDVRGPVATAPTASVGSAPAPGGGLVADAMVNANTMTEEEIARATGGRAFHDTNDLAGALSAATETGGHYYAMTYSPSNQNYDGRTRHIHVELAKKGYRLEYRRSYFGKADWSAEERERRPDVEIQPMAVSRPADSLSVNLQHGAPIAHQLLFRAHIHPLRPPAKASREQMERLAEQAASPDRKKEAPQKAVKSIHLQTYQIDYTIAARYPLLEIAAAAYDDDGKILNAAVERVIEEAAKQFPSTAKTGGAIYRVQQKFDVPVNAATVRVAVRDVATDNVGALEIKLPLAPDEASTEPSRVQEPADAISPKTAAPIK